MRTAAIRAATVGALLALAGGPARAEGTIYTLGSSLGLDFYRQDYGSLTVVSTSPSSPFLVPVEPGLRVGMVLPGERAEIATLLGMTVLSSEGEAVSALGFGLEGNYFFAGDGKVRPYAGLHFGVMHMGDFEGSSLNLTNVGGQIGARTMVSKGHGAIRVELRASAFRGEEGVSMTNLGTRIAYDLWFR